MFTILGIGILLLGIELFREGYAKNEYYKPVCLCTDGDRLCIAGVFTSAVGIALIIASNIWK